MHGSGARRMFFVHVMKTGGTAFWHLAGQNYGRDEMSTTHEGGDWLTALAGYTSVRTLADRPVEERQRLSYIAGHMPFAATELVDDDVLKVSALRDPVDRTISYLKHCQRMNPEHEGLALEAIYDDPWYFPRLVHDHQTKVFAMTLDETLSPPPPASDEITTFNAACTMEMVDSEYARLIEPIDRARLEVAKANLERLDVLGLHERYDRFLGQMSAVVGWRIDGVGRANVSDEAEISPELRRRIGEDNQLDAELVEHARSLLG